MDPAQLAHEACKRFEALHTSESNRSLAEPRDPQESRGPSRPREFAEQQGEQQRDEPLLEVFDHLGKLDGWAKIAMDRIAGDPQDGRAAQELCSSLEQTARLHPYFARRLADVLAVQ